MRSRKNRSPEEQARRARTRELLKKKQTGIRQDTFFQKAVFSDDGYHEKAEKTAAGLGRNLRPTGYFLRGQNAGTAENDPPVKGKCTAASLPPCHMILALFYAVIWTLHKIWDAAPKENDFLFCLPRHRRTAYTAELIALYPFLTAFGAEVLHFLRLRFRFVCDDKCIGR